MKILVIDDSPVERDNLNSILTSIGHSVITAENGDQGVQLAESEMPDLILCDVVMPVKDGFQTCRAIKKNSATKDIPVIMVTSKAEKADVVMAQLQGATDHIGKPYSDDDILSAVSKVG